MATFPAASRISLDLFSPKCYCYFTIVNSSGNFDQVRNFSHIFCKFQLITLPSTHIRSPNLACSVFKRHSSNIWPTAHRMLSRLFPVELENSVSTPLLLQYLKDFWTFSLSNVSNCHFIHRRRDCALLICAFQFNSIQFFIICVPSQQLQSQLQTEHSVDTSDYICKNT
jgi:hypothetical protein